MLKCKVFHSTVSINDLNNFLDDKNIDTIETMNVNGITYIVVYWIV